MALRNIFKKKKIEEKKEKPVEEVKSVEEKKGEKEKVVPPKKERKTVAGEAFRILKAPHVTEKATDLGKINQYVFKVWERANKTEIKKAIEDLYKVKVIDVKIINVPAKRRRSGRISGWKKGYKKVIVRIKEGQKIEVLPR